MGGPRADEGVEEEFGFVPRYQLNGRGLSLDELKVALEAAPSLSIDDRAINVLFRTQFFLGGATPFRELRRVVPEPVIVPPIDISREEAIDRFTQLFRDAVARRVGESNLVALSGGRDSRHILLELKRQHAPRLTAVSVELEMNEDCAVAREVASRAHVEHIIAKPSRTLDAALETIWRTGLLTLEHAWMSGITREKPGAVWWDGIAGDVMSAGHFLTDWKIQLFSEGRLDELAERLVAPGALPYFDDQRRFPRHDAVEDVHSELKRHVGAANPVGSFYFWNRTRNSVGASAFGLLRTGGRTVRAPFLDRELWSFLAAIPVHHFQDQTFHTTAIQRAYPSFADIGFSGRRAIAPSVHRRAAVQLLRHLALRRPTRTNLGTGLRLIRSLLIPARLTDVDWVSPTWLYGDTVSALAARRSNV